MLYEVITKNAADTEYQEMRQLVETAIQPLPYHDVAGTCGRDEKCLCLSCWVTVFSGMRC